MKMGLGLNFLHYGSMQPVFTPSSLSGLSLWLDASDIASITASSGAVSQWNDKSGNGNHATQATSANRPTTGTRTVNGKNVIDFDGTNDFFNQNSGMYGIANSDHTLFVVHATDSPAIAQTPYRLRDASNRLGISHSSTGNIYSTGLTTQQAVILKEQNTAAHISGMWKSGSSFRGFFDGVISDMSAAANFTATSGYISTTNASGEPVDGVYCEILHYARKLTNSEISQVNTYLGAKWNIPLNGLALVTDGNSITAGTAGTSWPSRVLALGTVPGMIVRNIAVSGQTTASMQADQATQMTPLLVPGRKNILTAWETTNTIYTAGAALQATAVSQLFAYADAARALGYKVIISGPLPANIATTTSAGDNNAAYNTGAATAYNAIKAGWASHADGFADLRDSVMGTYSTTYYADELHPNTAGYDVIAGIWAAEILRVSNLS